MTALHEDSRIRVTLADDSPFMIEGLRELLSLAEIDVVATCGSAEELLASVAADPPDVVVTDIRMPPDWTDEGAAAAKELRTSHPEVGVVVLSQFVDPTLALSVLGDGSSRRGYLLKENLLDVDRLVEAIRSVAQGMSFIDHAVIDMLVAARKDGTGIGRLSVREVEVLGEMAQGLSNAAIAARLNIGGRAVEKHINTIFTKLDLPSDNPVVHRRVTAVLRYLGSDTRASTSD